ncbi:unnamed protein product [Peniophora sp. CBMAI 1063]|nr:unnamed protein product [Peniophora sp. CBMAI 1063]
MLFLALLSTLAIAIASALAVPTVDLLIDHTFPNTGPLSPHQTLSSVSAHKGRPFHFGSSLNITIPHPGWPEKVFSDFFNHVVAENGCKWGEVERVRGVSDLRECREVGEFAREVGGSFRGHNTFWHTHLPSWLPGNFSAHTLVNNIIPTHVRAEISGMGPSVTSWDVVNEVVGDTVTSGMTPLECVQNKDVWPTVVSDGSSVPLVRDLSFLYAAFGAAFDAAGPSTRLSMNDYNTGADDAKTACNIALLKDIQKNTNIPSNRLALGFQSHINETTFVSKAQLAKTFAGLAELGVEAMITEIDITLNSSAEEDLRFQAAIWGDYIDVCLFATNCHEFINWDSRDDESWLGGQAIATLFDKNGDPKPAAYEVAARLMHFARGGEEVCATARGVERCRVG